ncbi:MAG: hypothetical protein U0694_22785 [Anaerolineae bacterium]
MDKNSTRCGKGGSIGTITEQDVHNGIRDIMGLTEAQVNAMADIWKSISARSTWSCSVLPQPAPTV